MSISVIIDYLFQNCIENSNILLIDKIDNNIVDNSSPGNSYFIYTSYVRLLTKIKIILYSIHIFTSINNILIEFHNLLLNLYTIT